MWILNGVHQTPIHTLQLNFCSLIGSLVSMRGVLKMSSSHPTVPDCMSASGAWSHMWLSHQLIHFFNWVKLLIFVMFGGIFKPFTCNYSCANDFVFLSCMIMSTHPEVLLLEKRSKSSALVLMLVLVQCTSVHTLDEHQHQCTCTGFEPSLSQLDLCIYWPTIITFYL